MQANIVLTLTGPDRVGIVEEVTRVLLAHGGNVETSRSVRLGGEFAMLMLVSMPAEQTMALEQSIASLTAQGFKVSAHPTSGANDTRPGWKPFQIEVVGADHEGIIYEVARYLAQRGISIESMDTATTPAPTSGSPLFSMKTLVVVPPDLLGQDWQAALADVGERLNVDINVASGGS